MAFDEGGKGEVVKEVGEIPPDVGVTVFPEAFVIKTIYLRNLSTFMVASKDGDAVTVAQFEGNEKSDGFDGVVPPVNVVAHEKVVGVG